MNGLGSGRSDSHQNVINSKYYMRNRLETVSEKNLESSSISFPQTLRGSGGREDVDNKNSFIGTTEYGRNRA